MILPELFQSHRERFGEAVQVSFEGADHTGEQLHERAGRLASGLASLGVEPGDRVVAVLSNSPTVPVVYEAVWRAGAVLVPLLPALAPTEIAHVIDDSQPAALIAGARTAPTVEQGAALACRTPPLVTDGPDAGSRPTIDRLVAGHDECPPADVDERSLAALLYTGGTTGQAKGVCLDHGNLASNAWAGAQTYEFVGGDAVIATLPLSHSYGLTTLLISQLTPSRMVILDRFRPATFAAAVAGHRATTADLVPTMLQMLVDGSVDDLGRLGTLRQVFVGGAPCPVELIAEFERATGVPVLQGYGLTEASPTVTSQRLSVPRKPGSVGQPVDGVTVRIGSPDGAEQAAGEPGEVQVSGPNVMAGYWHDEPATRAAIQDGWLRTGDLGLVDDDGDLFLVGRTKELIIRGGFNVFPQDVEAVVRTCPGVSDVTVAGIPSPGLGERIGAAVVGDVDVDAIRAHCERRLAATKRPDEIVIVDELPRTGVGKPDRRRTVELIAQRATQPGCRAGA